MAGMIRTKGPVDADFYPTEPLFTHLLLNVIRLDGFILEPACGDGAISKVLEARGHRVLSSDLYNRGYGISGVDFLQLEEHVDNILTNPPYFLLDDFIFHALKLARKKVCMLVGFPHLTGIKRFQELWSKAPPSDLVLVVNYMRVDGKKTGKSMFCHCWVVWDKEYSGPTRFHWAYDPE